MPIIPPKNNKDFDYELTPAGNHIAVLYKIVNIGTIETGFENEDGTPKKQPKVRLYFELSNEMKTYTDKDGNEVTKPFAVSLETTLSMYKGSLTAKLRTIAEAIVGTTLKDEEAEHFDIEQLLGRPCMVQVNHEKSKDGEKTYAKIATVSSLPKGMTAPTQVNTSEVLDVNLLTQEAIGQLPDFIRSKMESSDEYKKRFGTEIGPDGIPF